jgi:hypothetical protein
MLHGVFFVQSLLLERGREEIYARVLRAVPVVSVGVPGQAPVGDVRARPESGLWRRRRWSDRQLDGPHHVFFGGFG